MVGRARILPYKVMDKGKFTWLKTKDGSDWNYKSTAINVIRGY